MFALEFSLTHSTSSTTLSTPCSDFLKRVGRVLIHFSASHLHVDTQTYRLEQVGLTNETSRLVEKHLPALLFVSDSIGLDLGGCFDPI